MYRILYLNVLYPNRKLILFPIFDVKRNMEVLFIIKYLDLGKYMLLYRV